MSDKQKWEKKLQEQGFDAKLDEHNVIMLKTAEKEEAIRFKQAMEKYPYSWGIKRKGEGYDEGEVLSDFEEN